MAHGGADQPPLDVQIAAHNKDINEQLEEMRKLRAEMAEDKAAMAQERVAMERDKEEARVDRERAQTERQNHRGGGIVDPNAGEEVHTATSEAVLAKQTCRHVGCYYGVNGSPYVVEPDMVGPDKGRLKRVAKEMAIHNKEHTTNRINKQRDRPKERTRISMGMSMGDKMIWKERFERIKINYPFDDVTEEKAFIMESTDSDVKKLVGKLYIETETADEMAERILKIAAGQRNIILNMMKLMAPSNQMGEDECWDTYWARVKTQAKDCGFIIENHPGGTVDYSEEVAIRVAIIGVGEQIRQAAYGFGKLGTCAECPSPQDFGQAVDMVASHVLISKLQDQQPAHIGEVKGQGGNKRVIRGPLEGKDCFSCGTKNHSGKPPSDTHMKDFCPAWGKKCEYCKGENHYTKCRRKKKNDQKKKDKKGEVKADETPDQELKRLRETVAANAQLALEDHSATGGTNNSLMVRSGVANPTASGINYQGGGSQYTVLHALEIIEPGSADGATVTTHVRTRIEGQEGRTPLSNNATVKSMEGSFPLKGIVGKKVPHQHYCNETGQWKLGVVPHPQLQLKVRVADDNFIPNNEMSRWEKVYMYIEEKTVSDSGAQLTLLPRDKAEKLGLDVNKLSPGEIKIKGAGGEIIP